MDPYDNLFDGLSYDDQMLNDKLEFPFAQQKPQHKQTHNNDTQRLIRDQIKKELDLQQLEKSIETPIRESFCVSCPCMQKHDNDKEEPLFNEKTIIILLFVLIVCCIVQYFNQQQMLRDMNNILMILHSRQTPVIAQTV